MTTIWIWTGEEWMVEHGDAGQSRRPARRGRFAGELAVGATHDVMPVAPLAEARSDDVPRCERVGWE